MGRSEERGRPPSAPAPASETARAAPHPPDADAPRGAGRQSRGASMDPSGVEPLTSRASGDRRRAGSARGHRESTASRFRPAAGGRVTGNVTATPRSVKPLAVRRPRCSRERNHTDAKEVARRIGGPTGRRLTVDRTTDGAACTASAFRARPPRRSVRSQWSGTRDASPVVRERGYPGRAHAAPGAPRRHRSPRGRCSSSSRTCSVPRDRARA